MSRLPVNARWYRWSNMKRWARWLIIVLVGVFVLLLTARQLLVAQSAITSIAVDATGEVVFGNVTPLAQVTATIFTFEGVVKAQQTVQAASWGLFFCSFGGDAIVFGGDAIVPGDVVQVQVGTEIRSLTAPALDVQTDIAANTISGSGPVDRDIYIQAWNPCASEPCESRTETAHTGGAGQFSVDFSPFDIRRGARIVVSVYAPNGIDWTQTEVCAAQLVYESGHNGCSIGGCGLAYETVPLTYTLNGQPVTVDAQAGDDGLFHVAVPALAPGERITATAQSGEMGMAVVTLTLSVDQSARVNGEGPAPGERIAAQVYHQYAWHTCEITLPASLAYAHEFDLDLVPGSYARTTYTNAQGHAQRVTAEPQWKRVYLPLVLKRR